MTMFLCVDMFSNWPEAWSCKKAVQSPPSDQVCHDIQPRDWVCIRELCRKNGLKPRWSKPQHVLRTTITAVKCEGHHTWNHASHCKDPPPLKDNAGTGEADQQLLQSEEQRSDTGTRVPEEAGQHSLYLDEQRSSAGARDPEADEQHFPNHQQPWRKSLVGLLPRKFPSGFYKTNTGNHRPQK